MGAEHQPLLGLGIGSEHAGGGRSDQDGGRISKDRADPPDWNFLWQMQNRFKRLELDPHGPENGLDVGPPKLPR
eukprot:8716400-Alexandrium_andersonii.AAC.1